MRDVSAYRDGGSRAPPKFDSSIDAVRPDPPPPTMRTGTSRSTVTVETSPSNGYWHSRSLPWLAGETADVTDGGGIDVGHRRSEVHVAAVHSAAHRAADCANPVGDEPSLVGEAFVPERVELVDRKHAGL